MKPLTINQVVAFNLMRARRRKGWTQQETAEKLTEVMGRKWTKVSLGAAERSWETERVKQFDGNEIAAFCLVFGLPLAAFFLPPDTIERHDEFALGPGDAHTISAADLLRHALALGKNSEFTDAVRAAAEKAGMSWRPATPHSRPAQWTGPIKPLDDATEQKVKSLVKEMHDLVFGEGAS